MKYLNWRLSVCVLFVSVAPVGVKAFVPNESDLQSGKANLDKPPPPQPASQNVPAPTEPERARAKLKPAPPRPSEASE